MFIIKIINLKLISFYQIIPPLSKIAASNGHKDIVQFLASKGADIRHKKNDGWTALMWGIYDLVK